MALLRRIAKGKTVNSDQTGWCLSQPFQCLGDVTYKAVIFYRPV